jgi:serine/threonine-protein kinase
MADTSFDHLQDAVRHRYHLEGLVGRGGMGAVYRARHLSLDAPVAIKVLPIPASLGAEELARFRREAMLAARLPNPHIVPVYEFEISGDLAYLVMPLVDGVSLAQRLAKEGPLPLKEVRGLLEQVGGALGFAHERGVIHRDVKPANILWEPANRRWLITDFGIARRIVDGAEAITVDGAVLGTPAYMAPEQAAGAQVDGRTDLYALAGTACEALTGKRLRPFAAPAQGVEVLLAAGIPPAVATVIAAPLATNPDERPATAQVWLEQVERTERRPVRGWLLGLAAVATLAVLAGAGALLLRPRAPASPVGAVLAVLPFTDGTSLNLGREVARAFENELRWVPNVQVLPSAAAEGVLAEHGGGPISGDSASVLVLGAFPAATGVLSGLIEPDSAGLVRLRASLRLGDGSTRAAADRAAPADSLAAMVVAAVLDLFAPTGADAAYRPSLPGGGLAAMSALRAGDSLFRSGSYDAAVERYEQVLALDSTYALAAFKRMLAEALRAQPTRAGYAVDRVRGSLDPIRRYRDNLDPLNRELLQAYEVLITEGDVEGAHRQLRDMTERYPFSVDAWFVRGFLEFYFGPLFGTKPARARPALTKAAELDPGFAVVHGLLGWIALEEGDDEGAREQLRAYLAIDSTSTTAELVRLVDSLRLRGDRVAVAALRQVPDHSPATLEMFSLSGTSMRLSPAERLIVGDAARALRDGATTAEERATAFRLELGNALGAGRAATVDSLFREASRHNVPRNEVDRAAVLLATTGLGDATVTDAAITERAGRLAADTADPAGPWLAARWFRGRDAAQAREARQALQRLAATATGEAILARSLLGDLDALDRLDAGDTLGAFARWAQAMTRFQFEEVPFGLVASLWPLRLAWARTAAAAGNHDEVLLATATFEQNPAFMDQVARLIALPLRADALDATADRLAARDLRQRYARVLRDASGRWVAVRDSLLARSGGP